MSRRGWILFSAMCVIWGIPYLLIKVAVSDLSPVDVIFGRCLVAVVLLLPVAAARGELRPLLPYWRPLLAYTIIEVAIPWLLLPVAEQKLPSSLTGLLVAAVPLVGALLAFARGAMHELGLTRLAGLVIGLLGVGALVGLDVHGAQLGATLAVGVVAIGYAIGPILLSRYLGDLPPVGVVAASLTLVTIAYAPFALTSLPHRWPRHEVTESVLVLGVVCTAAAFLIFFGLIAEVGPVLATVITYVNPAVAVLLGALFLHEHISASTLVGFALILAGSFLATRPPRVAAGDHPELLVTGAIAPDP
jgi:drug/metabolite transporter (DMT)-like permease